MKDIKEIEEKQKEIEQQLDEYCSEFINIDMRYREEKNIIEEKLKSLQTQEKEVADILKKKWEQFAVKDKLIMVGIVYTERGRIEFKNCTVYRIIDGCNAIVYDIFRSGIHITKEEIHINTITGIMTRGKEITEEELAGYINVSVGASVSISVDVK